MESNKIINVYDFDGTLYNGDSSIDFFLFSLKKNKKNILLIPKIFIYCILYFFHFVGIEKLKSVFYSFLRNVDDCEKLVNDFWNKNSKKINNELGEIIKYDKNAVVVSAAPLFLLKPILSTLGVKKILASYVNISNGNLESENCFGENKTKFIKNNYKNYKINNSYSDSYSDRFIARKTDNAYMLYNKKICKYDEKKLFLKKIGKNSTIFALLFFIFYFVLGMLINYNYNLSSNYNLLFQSDTKRVFNDFTNILYNHSRVGVHPLILFIQPIIIMLRGITQNNFIAIAIFQAIVGSLSVKYLYKAVNLTTNNKTGNLLISLIYGLSFSSIIFFSTIEIYSLSALSLIVLWYYIIYDLKISDNVSIYKYIFFGICMTGILLTNYSVFFVAVLILLLLKKINITKFILINIITIISIVLLSVVQEFIWVSAPNIIKSFTTSVEKETENYTSFDISFEKIQNITNDVYMNGLVAKNVNTKQISGVKKFDNEHTVIAFNDGYNYKDIFIVVFYIVLIILIIINFKYNKALNIGLLLSLGGMTMLHLFYGNEDTFLYSQNFMYLIFLLFGLNYRKKNKCINAFLGFFIIYEIITNMIIFKNVLKIISRYVKANNILRYCGIYKEIFIFVFLIFAVLFILLLCYSFIKKYISNRNKKYLLYTFICLVLIPSIFIKLETFSNCNNRLNICGNNSETKLNIRRYDKVFKEFFSKEISEYEKYKIQYQNFAKGKNIFLINNFNNEKFYFFGLGNRNKYIYQNGVLKDLKTEKIYKRFDVDNDLIIPNQYMVLIKTKDNKIYKIVEDNKSVKIIGQSESTVVSGTENYINLKSFDNYKYSEILKVLYQEILFNIKDGAIYPNVIVYDEIWYRDSAYAAMVLEKTNNIDLISNWILSINDYYDKANGEEENDNLGEVLYLLSLVTNKDNNMVKKILSKLNKIKIEDEKGIYISNKTDGSIKPSYQTEWLKFGLEKLGIKNNYNYKSIDNYSNLLWFCNYPKKDLNIKNYNKNYPYLGYAQRHLIDEEAKIYVSNQLYPLSWENNAKEADYNKMTVLGNYFIKNKVSPTHIWSASELFLLLENKD